MITIILTGAFVVFLVAALRCLIVRLRSGSDTGRQVDIRVLSCEQKCDAQNRLYYEIKGDFYGADGEVLVRTMQSAKKYMPGDIIHCRYLEQTGLLFEEMTHEVRKKSGNNVLLFLVIVIIFVGIVIAVVAGGGVFREAGRPIAYLISVLFMAVGIFGIYNKIQMKQKLQGMISLPGVQVDYTINQSMDSDGPHTVLYYHPVYEYEWEGEKRRIAGPVGSSGKKYRTIGRRVHILVNPHTGKAVCQEDEKTRGNVYLLFGIIGLAVFAVLLTQSIGVLF